MNTKQHLASQLESIAKELRKQALAEDEAQVSKLIIAQQNWQLEDNAIERVLGKPKFENERLFTNWCFSCEELVKYIQECWEIEKVAPQSIHSPDVSRVIWSSSREPRVKVEINTSGRSVSTRLLFNSVDDVLSAMRTGLCPSFVTQLDELVTRKQTKVKDFQHLLPIAIADADFTEERVRDLKARVESSRDEGCIQREKVVMAERQSEEKKLELANILDTPFASAKKNHQEIDDQTKVDRLQDKYHNRTQVVDLIMQSVISRLEASKVHSDERWLLVQNWPVLFGCVNGLATCAVYFKLEGDGYLQLSTDPTFYAPIKSFYLAENTPIYTIGAISYEIATWIRDKHDSEEIFSNCLLIEIARWIRGVAISDQSAQNKINKQNLDVPVENQLSMEYLASHLPVYFTWSLRIRPESKYWDVIGKRERDCDATRQIIKLGLDPQRFAQWTKLLESQFGVFSTGLESNPNNPPDMSREAALTAAKEAKAGDPETCFLWLQFPREKALQFVTRNKVLTDEVSMNCGASSRHYCDLPPFGWNESHGYAFAAFTLLTYCKESPSLTLSPILRERWLEANRLAEMLRKPMRQVFNDIFGSQENRKKYE